MIIAIVYRRESSSGLRGNKGGSAHFGINCCLRVHRRSEISIVKLVHVLIENSVLGAGGHLLLFNLI
jgi:hypothetical protein